MKKLGMKTLGIKTLLTMLPLAALAFAGPVLAQATQGPVAAAEPGERVNQVIVYGDDPCPSSNGNDIVVCVRSADAPYRLPKAMRSDPQDPINQAWAARAKSIEYVGRTGTNSCSPVGGNGASGCFNQIVRQARAERAQAGTWTTLVEAERAKRLGTIDADSDAIEARVKAEEAAVAAGSASSAPPPPMDAGPANR